MNTNHVLWIEGAYGGCEYDNIFSAHIVKFACANVVLPHFFYFFSVDLSLFSLYIPCQRIRDDMTSILGIRLTEWGAPLE